MGCSATLPSTSTLHGVIGARIHIQDPWDVCNTIKTVPTANTVSKFITQRDRADILKHSKDKEKNRLLLLCWMQGDGFAKVNGYGVHRAHLSEDQELATPANTKTFSGNNMLSIRYF